jgi:hypothetical protein
LVRRVRLIHFHSRPIVHHFFLKLSKIEITENFLRETLRAAAISGQGYGDDGFSGIAPVKSFPPNNYGLYDRKRLACSDWYRPDYFKQLADAGGVARNPHGPETPFDPVSTLAQSTLRGLFGLLLLVVAKATYLTFPHVPTHSAAGSSASYWSLGFPRPPDRRRHRRFSQFSVFHQHELSIIAHFIAIWDVYAFVVVPQTSYY